MWLLELLVLTQDEVHKSPEQVGLELNTVWDLKEELPADVLNLRSLQPKPYHLEEQVLVRLGHCGLIGILELLLWLGIAALDALVNKDLEKHMVEEFLFGGDVS